jgi:hypothetical protein
MRHSLCVWNAEQGGISLGPAAGVSCHGAHPDKRGHVMSIQTVLHHNHKHPATISNVATAGHDAGIERAGIHAKAANRIRQDATRRGVKVDCRVNGHALAMTARSAALETLETLLGRAIGRAQRGSIVTCEASLCGEEARCHLRFAVPLSAALQSKSHVDWIDEVWSWRPTRTH